MTVDRKRLGQLRQDQGEIANHIIDEFAAGRLSRRDFIRRGSRRRLGAAARLDPRRLRQQREDHRAGASSHREGRPAPGAGSRPASTPAAAINPVTVADQGGLDMLAQTGEYLCLSTQTLVLKPALPPAGRRTPSPTCGRSRSARGSSSTTARR